MKLKALIALYGIILLTSIIQSCCVKEYKYIGIEKIRAYNHPAEGEVSTTDTIITGPFSIEVYFDIDRVAQMAPSFINTSYAGSCEEYYVNEVDEYSMTLTVDKPIQGILGIIGPGSNLLTLSHITIHHDPYSYSPARFVFNQNFFNGLTFLNEAHIFTLTATAGDGSIFTSELTLTFNL